MRKFLIAASVLTVSCLFSCGPSKADQERIEKERQDSIAKVEKEKELTLQKLEQERQDSIARAEKRKQQWATDSVEISKLLPEFSITKDEELENGRIYVAKGMSTSHFRDGAYISFTTLAEKVGKLFINASVTSDNAYLLDYITLIIGDNTFDIYPDGEVGLSTDRFPIVAEWFKGDLNSNLSEKILEAQSLKIKVVGSDGNKLLNITSGDLEKMKKTIMLYNLFNRSKVI